MSPVSPQFLRRRRKLNKKFLGQTNLGCLKTAIMVLEHFQRSNGGGVEVARQKNQSSNNFGFGTLFVKKRKESLLKRKFEQKI